MCNCGDLRYLLSVHGSVLSLDRQRSRIEFANLHAVRDRKSLIAICPDCGAAFSGLEGGKSRIYLEPSCTIRGFGTEKIDVITHDGSSAYGTRFVSIRLQGVNLSAQPAGAAEFREGPVEAWEIFRILTVDEMESVVDICENDWFIPSRNTVVRGKDIEINSEIFEINGCVYDRYKILLDDFGTLKSYIVFSSNWKIERVVKYKPIIFYVYFGKDERLSKQFRVSLDSLFALGSYSGYLCIVGDLDPRQLAYLPAEKRARITFVRRVAVDRLDQVAARLIIPEIFPCQGFQPLVYADCDILYDKPIDSCLTQVLLSEKMSAQQEDFSLLTRDVSVGSELFQADNLTVDNAHGFCAGLMAFPSSGSMERILKVAAFCMEQHARVHGRDFLSHKDQAILNYVLYKLSAIEAAPLTRATRTGYDHTVAEHALEHQRGFVHFCGVSGNKHVAMQEYFMQMVPAVAK